MNARFMFYVGLSAGALFIAGCDEFDQALENPAQRPAGGQFAPPQVNQTPSPQPKAADTATPADPNAPTTLQPGQENDPTLRKVDPTVGKQGKEYGGGALMAPITTPVREYFGMRAGITFDMIKHDVDIFKAAHNRYPKDDKEFKTEILDKGQRELPELPAGNTYVYDPKTGQLFVRYGGQQQ
jgi:hypothetical protein